MSVSPARRIAFDILRRVESEGAFASDLLHTDLTAGIKRQDAALATELTLGVLRWRRLLDFLLDTRLKRPMARLDLEVALALRIGLYQLRFLDRVPARAAIHESVELVRAVKKASAAPLVNAVLNRVRSAAKDNVLAARPANAPPDPDLIGIAYSHPTWLVQRWLAAYGEADALALLQVDNRPANLSCALHLSDQRVKIIEELETNRIRFEPGKLLRDSIVLRGGSPVLTSAFRSGWLSIQDEASQLIPRLLHVQPGDRVLDLCAAPGGKTILLAQSAGAAGFIVAADHHAHRLRALQAHVARCRLDRVHVVELDAESSLPFQPAFNRILVDAPCSGTGTLARHPEIRWRLLPKDLLEFHRRQVAILRAALAPLLPGGRIVYSTCSLEPEENEQVVSEVLAAAPDFQLVPRGTAECRDMEELIQPLLAEGVSASSLFPAPSGKECRPAQRDDSRFASFFRTFPPTHQSDGFFAAVIEKRR
jgi:16S rRNA (cytosine967-C5)-methyltransferase